MEPSFIRLYNMHECRHNAHCRCGPVTRKTEGTIFKKEFNIRLREVEYLFRCLIILKHAASDYRP